MQVIIFSLASFTIPFFRLPIILDAWFLFKAIWFGPLFIGSLLVKIFYLFGSQILRILFLILLQNEVTKLPLANFLAVFLFFLPQSCFKDRISFFLKLQSFYLFAWFIDRQKFFDPRFSFIIPLIFGSAHQFDSLNHSPHPLSFVTRLDIIPAFFWVIHEGDECYWRFAVDHIGIYSKGRLFLSVSLLVPQFAFPNYVSPQDSAKAYLPESSFVMIILAHSILRLDDDHPCFSVLLQALISFLQPHEV